MRKLLLILVAVCWIFDARAASIEPVRANILATDEGYALSADFAIDLGPRVEDTVARGVPLYFNLDLNVFRSRNWWFDEHVLDRTLTYRLSYNALTRQYRLSTGGLARSFDTLADALHAMGHITALPISDRSTFKSGEKYHAEIRLALDRGQLPKPFQIDAIASRDWQVEAAMLQWEVTP